MHWTLELFYKLEFDIFQKVVVYFRNPISDYQIPMDTAAPELKTKPCSSAQLPKALNVFPTIALCFLWIPRMLLLSVYGVQKPERFVGRSKPHI